MSYEEYLDRYHQTNYNMYQDMLAQKQMELMALSGAGPMGMMGMGMGRPGMMGPPMMGMGGRGGGYRGAPAGRGMRY